MRMRFSLLLLVVVFLTSHMVEAQQVAVGVVGGVRTTDDVSGSLTTESKRYIVGPSVDIRLPKQLSFEFDALYRRFGFTGYENSCCGFGSAITRERANSWEFPMILKYHLHVGPVHPFVGVGYAPRIVHGTDVASGSYLTGISDNPPMNSYTYFFNQRTPTSYPVTQGVIISGGVSRGIGHVLFTPEVRYVHWNAPFLNQSHHGSDAFVPFISQQDEVFVLLGVSWH